MNVKEKAAVIIGGAGLAGLITAAELRDAGLGFGEPFVKESG
jgi:monoamine oxidase